MHTKATIDKNLGFNHQMDISTLRKAMARLKTSSAISQGGQKSRKAMCDTYVYVSHLCDLIDLT